MTISGEIATRYRDISEMPDEVVLCTIRGGHGWHVESEFDTQSFGMLPGSSEETRAHVFVWRCTCDRVKREVWDNYDGELISKSYAGGHLLLSGRPRVTEARREWIARLRKRGASVLAAMKLLKTVG